MEGYQAGAMGSTGSIWIFTLFTLFSLSSGWLVPFDGTEMWCEEDITNRPQPCLVLRKNRKSWSDAKNDCENLKGHLLTLSSIKVWQAVSRGDLNLARYWIGGKFVETDWGWSNGRVFNLLQGCYLEDLDNPDLDTPEDDVKISSSDFRKPQDCLNKCRLPGYRYTGVIIPQGQSQGRCRCGKGKYGKHGKPSMCKVKSDGTLDINPNTHIEIVFNNRGINGDWEEDLSEKGKCAYLGFGGKLFTTKCFDERQYICEYASNSPECEAGAVVRTSKNYKCLRLWPGAINWFRAHTECAKGGGRLFAFTKDYGAEDLLRDDSGDILGLQYNMPWVDLSRWKLTWHNPEFKDFGYNQEFSLTSQESSCMYLQHDMSLNFENCREQYPYICELSKMEGTKLDPSSKGGGNSTDSNSTRNIIIGVTASVFGSILLTVIVNLICYSIRRSSKSEPKPNDQAETPTPYPPSEINWPPREEDRESGLGSDTASSADDVYIQPLPSFYAKLKRPNNEHTYETLGQPGYEPNSNIR